ncbi:ShlB/FhaC/HecB family hemolysin secretion/activation protein [Shewanella cyperi]
MMVKIRLLLLTPALLLSPWLMADERQAIATQTGDAQEAPQCPVNRIIVISHPIFDESDPDTFFIHRWANFLHINTRESTVRKLLSFKEQDEVDSKDLEEAQRLLRAEPFLRDAAIHFAEPDPQADDTGPGKDVVVETWDNWSLLPTFSASRTGGASSFSFGIKEDNLLGTGIHTRVKYQSNEDRTGYKLAFDMPLAVVPHGRVGFDFYDNSDGQAKHLYFERPFYTLDGDKSYGLEYLDDLRTDTIRQNGQDINEFEHSVDYANVHYGWLSYYDGHSLQRWSLGLTRDRNDFAPSPLYPGGQLPQDRDFLYPWLGWEYLQDDFRVLRNVHLINYNEDYNLGWHHSARLGFETRDTDNTLGYHLGWQSSRGYMNDDHLILLNLDANATLATRQANTFKTSLLAEYFYQINPKWTAYGKLKLSASRNAYYDQQFALGDETGLRGFPNDYQHGDHQWLLSAEIRNYPNINLYQLAELGWAAFVDLGQSFGGEAADNNEIQGPIGAVGLGARIYSSRSSYGHVAHIDITVPFVDGEHVDSWEWRFQVRNHF